MTIRGQSGSSETVQAIPARSARLHPALVCFLLGLLGALPQAIAIAAGRWLGAGPLALLGWPTNLLLWAHKPAAASARPPKQEHTARVVSIPSQHCLAIIAADAWSQS